MKTVVLPAPLGPMMPVMLPSATSKERESTAFIPSKCFVRPRTEKRGAAGEFTAASQQTGPPSCPRATIIPGSP